MDEDENLLLNLLSKNRLGLKERNLTVYLARKINNREYLDKKLTSSQNEKLQDLFDRKRIKDSIEIIKEFNKAGINFAVLKGLTFRKFNKKRSAVDLDIFIDKNDIEKALKISKKWYNYAFSDEKIRKIVRLDSFGKHQIKLISPDTITLELHPFLFYGSLIDSEKLNLKNNKIYLKFNRIKIPCLIPELQLFYALIRWIDRTVKRREIIKEGKEINDIKLILENYEINWDKFIRMVKKFGCLEIIYLLISELLSAEKFKFPIPSNKLDEIYALSSKWRLFLINKAYKRKYPALFLINKAYKRKYHRLFILLSLNLYSSNFFRWLFIFFIQKPLYKLDPEIKAFCRTCSIT
jgi:hypothetical protein